LEEVVRAGREGAAVEKGGLLEGVRWVAMDFLREAPVKGTYDDTLSSLNWGMMKGRRD
jgi:hypothetical protein